MDHWVHPGRIEEHPPVRGDQAQGERYAWGIDPIEVIPKTKTVHLQTYSSRKNLLGDHAPAWSM